MSTSPKELEKRLLEAAKALLYPPLLSSAEKLLHFLDNLFICLLEVEQSPPSSIQNALSPLTKALADERLSKHSNVDVIVSVASCITEVTRINAPVAPYVDEKMREVLQLIVSSFEHLDDKYSLSYTKRTSILNTVARCQVSFLMLDPVYDALRIEMFQHFLKGIRDHHPLKVFSDMENIMTLVLKESDDISPELLAPILHYVEKNDEVPAISRKLAEKVLLNCSSKCETYLAEAVKSSGVSLDKYGNVVTLICEGAVSVLKQNIVEDKQNASELSAHEQTDTPEDQICKSRAGNGGVQTALSASLVDTDSTKKQNAINAEDESQKLDNAVNSGLDDSTVDEKTGRCVKAVNQKRKESLRKEAKPSASEDRKKSKLTKTSSNAKPTAPPTKKNTSEIKSSKHSEKTTYLGDNKKPVVSYGKSDSKSKTEVKQPLEKTLSYTNAKRKHSLDTEKASDDRKYDENLVGSRVGVWWPMDKKYYKGKVTSYDSSRKRHTVIYEDGDKETLYLKNHSWYLVDPSKSLKDQEKAAEVSNREQTGATKRRLNLSLPHEGDPSESETVTQKRARVQSCKVQKAHGEMEKTAAEGEPSCGDHKSSPELGESQACSVTHQLAKVKQSIADTIASVRQFGSEVETKEESIVNMLTSVEQFRSELETKEQSIVDMLTSVRQFRSELETKEQVIVDTLTSVQQFRSEIKTKESNLMASLHEVDVLGKKISGINKILNS